MCDAPEGYKMNVLLSIKPKYANQIINGNKKYEFRKSVFKNRDLDFCYFRGKEKGFAIEIGEVKAFDPINPKEVIPGFVPPQSFCYTDKHWAGVV